MSDAHIHMIYTKKEKNIEQLPAVLVYFCTMHCCQWCSAVSAFSVKCALNYKLSTGKK